MRNEARIVIRKTPILSFTLCKKFKTIRSQTNEKTFCASRRKICEDETGPRNKVLTRELPYLRRYFWKRMIRKKIRRFGENSKIARIPNFNGEADNTRESRYRLGSAKTVEKRNALVFEIFLPRIPEYEAQIRKIMSRWNSFEITCTMARDDVTFFSLTAKFSFDVQSRKDDILGLKESG